MLQFLARFGNPLVLVLLFASALSAVTGNLTSFVIITVIVLLSVVLDFVQEVRAQNAVEALRRSVALQADVWRDGTQTAAPWTGWFLAMSFISAQATSCPPMAGCWNRATCSSIKPC